jgi:hypothetical protein
MQLDQLVHEGQPDPGAFLRSAMGAFDPVKALE